MNVSLTPKLEAFVRRKVTQGLYGSANEVVCEALRRQVEAEGSASDAPSLGELIDLLRSLEPVLRARGVNGLHLVGSHARGEARPDSDIDSLIDPDPHAPSPRATQRRARPHEGLGSARRVTAATGAAATP